MSSDTVYRIKETCSSVAYSGQGLWVFNLEVFLDCCVVLKHMGSGLFLFEKGVCFCHQKRSQCTVNSQRRNEHKLQHLKQCKYEETEGVWRNFTFACHLLAQHPQGCNNALQTHSIITCVLLPPFHWEGAEIQKCLQFFFNSFHELA